MRRKRQEMFRVVRLGLACFGLVCVAAWASGYARGCETDTLGQVEIPEDHMPDYNGW